MVQWLRIHLPMQVHGFDPWSGKRPHPQSSQAPCARNTEPELCKGEANTMRSSPHSLQLQKAHKQQWGPNAAQNKIKYIFFLIAVEVKAFFISGEGYKHVPKKYKMIWHVWEVWASHSRSSIKCVCVCVCYNLLITNFMTLNPCYWTLTFWHELSEFTGRFIPK